MWSFLSSSKSPEAAVPQAQETHQTLRRSPRKHVSSSSVGPHEGGGRPSPRPATVRRKKSSSARASSTVSVTETPQSRSADVSKEEEPRDTGDRRALTQQRHSGTPYARPAAPEKQKQSPSLLEIVKSFSPWASSPTAKSVPKEPRQSPPVILSAEEITASQVLPDEDAPSQKDLQIQPKAERLAAPSSETFEFQVPASSQKAFPSFPGPSQSQTATLQPQEDEPDKSQEEFENIVRDLQPPLSVSALPDQLPSKPLFTPMKSYTAHSSQMNKKVSNASRITKKIRVTKKSLIYYGSGYGAATLSSIPSDFSQPSGKRLKLESDLRSIVPPPRVSPFKPTAYNMSESKPSSKASSLNVSPSSSVASAVVVPQEKKPLQPKETQKLSSAAQAILDALKESSKSEAQVKPVAAPINPYVITDASKVSQKVEFKSSRIEEQKLKLSVDSISKAVSTSSKGPSPSKLTSNSTPFAKVPQSIDFEALMKRPSTFPSTSSDTPDLLTKEALKSVELKPPSPKKDIQSAPLLSSLTTKTSETPLKLGKVTPIDIVPAPVLEKKVEPTFVFRPEIMDTKPKTFEFHSSMIDTNPKTFEFIPATKSISPKSSKSFTSVAMEIDFSKSQRDFIEPFKDVKVKTVENIDQKVPGSTSVKECKVQASAVPVAALKIFSFPEIISTKKSTEREEVETVKKMHVSLLPSFTFEASVASQESETNPTKSDAALSTSSFNWAAAGMASKSITKSGWDCPVCMISNKADAMKCAACESDKPGSSKTGNAESKPVSSSFSTTNMSSGGFSWTESSFKPSQNTGWTCAACLVPNKQEALKCVSCETEKPGSMKASGTTLSVPKSQTTANGFNWAAAGMSTKPASKSGWECSVCMVQNKIEDEKCVACETPNPLAKKEEAATKTNGPPAFNFGNMGGSSGGFNLSTWSSGGGFSGFGK